jgi:uncharacterized protein (TIGR03000 family)
MSQKGTLRQFVTPPVDPGRVYSYQIRARWQQNGQVMDQTKIVQFHAGDRLTVDFGS